MSNNEFTVGRTVYRIRVGAGGTYYCPVTVKRLTSAQIIVETPKGQEERYWRGAGHNQVGAASSYRARGIRTYIRQQPPLMNTKMKLSAEAGDWKVPLAVYHVEEFGPYGVRVKFTDTSKQEYDLSRPDGQKALAALLRHCGVETVETLQELVGLPVDPNPA